MSDANVFRENLRRLSGQIGLQTPQQLAKEMGYKLKDLRWIKRLWERGLERPDTRRAGHLNDLAALFGAEPEDLWKAKIEVNHNGVFRNPRHWAEFVREVIETYCRFQQLKLQSRRSAIQALDRYDFDEACLIADIVAVRLGLDRSHLSSLGLSHLDQFQKRDREWKALVNHIASKSEDDALVAYVITESMNHEWFPELLKRLTDRYGNGVDQHIRQVLLNIQRRPRTPPEVLNEFRVTCLDSQTEDDGFEEAMRDISSYLRCKWRDAVARMNVPVTPKMFAKVVIDGLEQSGDEF